MQRRERLQQLELAFIHAGGIHPNVDIELARFRIVFHLLVPELQGIHVDREADGFGFTGFRLTFSKPRSCFTGRLMDAVTS